MTWELIGELQVTDLSLKFFRQFDPNIKVGTYRKGSEVYESLTYALTSWAERTLLFLGDHTPEDYVLPLAIDRTTGDPTGPRGVIHCQSAVLSVYDAYNGLIPPSWAHGGYPWNDAELNRDDYDHCDIRWFGEGSQISVGYAGDEAEKRLQL